MAKIPGLFDAQINFAASQNLNPPRPPPRPSPSPSEPFRFVDDDGTLFMFGQYVGKAADPSDTYRFGDFIDDGVSEAEKNMIDELWDKYDQQIKESEGFEFKDRPPCRIPIMPWTESYHNSNSRSGTVDGLVKGALQHHEGYEEFELVKVLIVNKDSQKGFFYTAERYYITFLAKKPGADPITFQLRVVDVVSGPIYEVFRVKASTS